MHSWHPLSVMTDGYNHSGKSDAFFHSPGVAGEARVKGIERFGLWHAH